MLTFKEFKNLRNLKTFTNSLSFSSNDYLCLSKNQLALNFASKFAESYSGAGSNGSRILTDNSFYSEFESFFSLLKKKESCLLFPSGWQMNVSTLSTILNAISGSCDVFTDRLNHNSLQIAIQLTDYRQKRYRNNDLSQLEDILKKSDAKNKIVITESVFSMDGTILNIADMIYLKQKYGFFLYLDDAHSFGVFGDNLTGITEGYEDQIDIIAGTLSKSVGAQGGYLLSSKKIRNLVINKSPGFIYSTGLSPFLVGFSYFVIKNLLSSVDLKNSVKNMLENASFAVKIFQSIGYKIDSKSQIIPLITGDEKLNSISQKLKLEQIDLPLITYPTVPIGASRFRMSLNINHSKDDIMKIYDILQ